MKLVTKILLLMLIPQIMLFAGSSFSGERLKEICIDYLQDKLGEDKAISLFQSIPDQKFQKDGIKARFNEKLVEAKDLNHIEIEFISEGTIVKTLKVYYTISTEKNVAYTIKSIGKGEVITREHIVIKRTKISANESGDIPSPESIIGKKSEANIAKGVIIKASQLEESVKITRGDKVVIVAGMPGLQIKLEGTALQDAKVGQPIRIQKEDKQILQGKVREDGYVEILRN